MATMKQVAERAGVSTSTVSHVINNTRAVSDDVRKRVLAVIEEMRYIPSAVARSLKNDKTYTIGVSVPDNTHPGLAQLLRGIEDAAFAVGYNIMLCNGYEDAQRQAAQLRGLIEKRIDGLVLVGGSTRGQLAPLLASQSLPIVLADHEVPGLEADFIGLDHEAAGYAAGRHLIELGHRRIACLAGPERQPAGQERLAGFRRALREAGIELGPAYLLHGDADCEGGHAAARRLLALPLPPSARRVVRGPGSGPRPAGPAVGGRLRRPRRGGLRRAAPDHGGPTRLRNGAPAGRTAVPAHPRRRRRAPARTPAGQPGGAAVHRSPAAAARAGGRFLTTPERQPLDKGARVFRRGGVQAAPSRPWPAKRGRTTT